MAASSDEFISSEETDYLECVNTDRYDKCVSLIGETSYPPILSGNPTTQDSQHSYLSFESPINPNLKLCLTKSAMVEKSLSLVSLQSSASFVSLESTKSIKLITCNSQSIIKTKAKSSNVTKSIAETAVLSKKGVSNQKPIDTKEDIRKIKITYKASRPKRKLASGFYKRKNGIVPSEEMIDKMGKMDNSINLSNIFAPKIKKGKSSDSEIKSFSKREVLSFVKKAEIDRWLNSNNIYARKAKGGKSSRFFKRGKALTSENVSDSKTEFTSQMDSTWTNTKSIEDNEYGRYSGLYNYLLKKTPCYSKEFIGQPEYTASDQPSKSPNSIEGSFFKCFPERQFHSRSCSPPKPGNFLRKVGGTRLGISCPGFTQIYNQSDGRISSDAYLHTSGFIDMEKRIDKTLSNNREIHKSDKSVHWPDDYHKPPGHSEVHGQSSMKSELKPHQNKTKSSIPTSQPHRMSKQGDAWPPMFSDDSKIIEHPTASPKDKEKIIFSDSLSKIQPYRLTKDDLECSLQDGDVTRCQNYILRRQNLDLDPDHGVLDLVKSRKRFLKHKNLVILQNPRERKYKFVDCKKVPISTRPTMHVSLEPMKSHHKLKVHDEW